MIHWKNTDFSIRHKKEEDHEEGEIVEVKNKVPLSLDELMAKQRAEKEEQSKVSLQL